jgi:hypothetical protein
MIINVRMKRGGKVPMEVEARVYGDSNGAGRRWTECEIEGIYWLGGSKGKRYSVNDNLIASVDEVQEDFINKEESRVEENRVDYLLSMREER